MDHVDDIATHGMLAMTTDVLLHKELTWIIWIALTASVVYRSVRREIRKRQTKPETK